ncbi:aminotransferase class V-fold PLP-dependent enzyme [Serratia ureilytica]
MTPFNPSLFRQQFPALAQDGIYLDSAATALKPQAVIDATQHFIAMTPPPCTAASIGRRRI